MKEEQFELIAKTLYGLEDVLAEELLALKADDVQTGRRMVSFKGDKALMYKANFYCRTALRILKPILHFKASDADTVYNEIKKIEWDEYFTPDKTFAVDSVIYSENFNHSKFVAYRTKDAIVDYFNEKYELRPSVRVNRPDMYVNIHISHHDCTISIDSSGESLHKRGYRIEQVDAPLNEVLAAGMILKTGWWGESNFVDPMCGSGTLLIEAAMIAMNIPPGLYRKEYGFERWTDFDQDLFDEIYNDESREKEFAFKCFGSDVSPIAIEIAQKNVKSAGLSKYIELTTLPFQQYSEAPNPGILVTNPPYGERISTDDIISLYAMIGERLKHVFMGYQAWILSYKDECFDKIGLRPSQKMKLMNGQLDCEYRCYELFKGKSKEYKTEMSEQRPFHREDRGRSFEGERGSYSAERKTFEKRERPSSEDRRPYAKDRSFSKDKPFSKDRPYGKDKPSFSKSDRPYSKDRPDYGKGDRSFSKPYSNDAPYSKDRSFSKDKPFSKDRPYGKDKPSFSKSDRPYSKDRPDYGKGDRSFSKPYSNDAPYSKDRSFSKDKPFSKDRPYGKDKPSFSKSDRPYSKDRPDYGKGDRSFSKPYSNDTPYSKDRSFSKDKPFSKDRSYGKDKPSFSKSDRPYSKDRPDYGKGDRSFSKPYSNDTPYSKDRSFSKDKPFSKDRSYGNDKPSFSRSDRPYSKDKPAYPKREHADSKTFVKDKSTFKKPPRRRINEN